MSKISISYRRRDSDAITGRIFDRLVAHYGPEAVFRDIDNIPPGVDFRRYIGEALDSTDVLLAIVGPQWLGKAEGRARITEATDLVRIEIEAALKKDIPVVPVLVGNATMPEASELPDGLKDFVFRNAVKIDALEDFDDHIRRLIRNLDRLLGTAAQQVPPGPTPVPPPPAPPPKPESPSLSDIRRMFLSAANPFELNRARHAVEAVLKREPDNVDALQLRDQLDTAITREQVMQPQARAAPPPHDRVASGPTELAISPLLVMPLLVIALYGILYFTGATSLGQASGYPPAVPLAQAVLFVVCVAWYGRAGIGAALVGGGALWLAASALMLGNTFIISGPAFATMSNSARGAYATLFGVISSTLLAAFIMAIGARLCPVLRQAHFWIIALIGYPVFSLVLGLLNPALLLQSADRDSLLAGLFGIFVIKQLAIFTCLGAWVSQPAPDVPGDFR